MSTRTLAMSDSLYSYFHAVSIRETALMQALRKETEETGWERMQVSPEQGQFMALLLEIMGATRVLEVGTFTGYSALCMAQSLPEDGLLICCDVSEEWTSMGRKYWEQAGVAQRIDLRLAPAAETLQGLLDDGQQGSFDFAFIDADKANYDTYFERSLQLLRQGGVIAIDNVFWGGKVADPSVTDEDTAAIRTLTQKLHSDSRVSISLVPIGDGLLLARKR